MSFFLIDIFFFDRIGPSAGIYILSLVMMGLVWFRITLSANSGYGPIQYKPTKWYGMMIGLIIIDPVLAFVLSVLISCLYQKDSYDFRPFWERTDQCC